MEKKMKQKKLREEAHRKAVFTKRAPAREFLMQPFTVKQAHLVQ
jgi:hypothetical protein